MPCHHVFVSYHHANDQYYREAFETKFGLLAGVFISKSVQMGDISPLASPDSVRARIRDDYLRDSTVTVVLIGCNTWQRKHVDWEIGSSIRSTRRNSRSGLLGIILPTHPSFGAGTYDEGVVPPRLVDNQTCGFANIYDWTENSSSIHIWIQQAFDCRFKIQPDNSYPHFVNNKSSARWC